MRKIKVLLTKIEDVRRVERVKYLATVNLSKKVKQVEKYLKRKITEGDEIDIVAKKVVSVDILDSDMVNEETEGVEIKFDGVRFAKQNKSLTCNSYGIRIKARIADFYLAFFASQWKKKSTPGTISYYIASTDNCFYAQ